MDRYNVLAGLIVNPDNNRWTAYKEEEVDNNTGLYYKVEDVEPLQLELVEVKQQNDRLQKRCKELEGENERLNNTLKQILDYYINVMGDVTGKIIPCDIADEARRLGVIE